MTHTHRWANGLAVLLLLLTLSQLLWKSASPTAEEQEGIARGCAYLLRGVRLNGQTPLLAHVLSALPLTMLTDLKFPFDDPTWAERNSLQLGDQILWRLGNDATQILFWARLPTAFLTLLLAAFIYRWAGELYGRPAGLLSLLFCTFDPNLLAHGRLATADLLLTAWVLMAAYWLWRLLKRPTVLYSCLAGIALGLALTTRFLAWLCLPIGGLLLLARAWRPEPYRLPVRLPLVASLSGRTRSGRLGWLIASALIILLTALLTIWTAYGLEVGELDGIRVLAPSYWAQLRHAPNSFAIDNSMHFLRGELYTGRRHAYLLIAFLLKTPLPVLAFGVASLVAALRRRTWWHDFLVCSFPLLVIAVGLLGRVNAGYRYLLPALPFVLVMAGSAMTLLGGLLSGAQAFVRHFSLFGLLVALLGWQIFGTLSVAPHYLAYFNEIAGGPENGWQVLIDQDLDRGQALNALKEWMDRHSVSKVKLAYQGVADPAFYGIDFEPLPVPIDTWETLRSFYPADPAPGFYAISVNSLQGLHMPDPDTYAWFRERQPLAKIGYSIFIYQVPRTGSTSVVVALSGLRAAEICPEDYRLLLGTNDVQFKWFDASRSLILPARSQANGYLVVAGDMSALSWANELVSGGIGAMRPLVTCTDRPYVAMPTGWNVAQIAADILTHSSSAPVWWSPAITFLPGDPEAHAERLALPVNFGRQVELLSYRMSQQVLVPGQNWELLTWWRVAQADGTPLKLFVHLIDGQSKLLGGDDRLDVPVDGWQSGDLFYQIHRLTLPADTLPGIYQVELGWYDARTIERLPVWGDGYAIADRVLLTPVEVTQP